MLVVIVVVVVVVVVFTKARLEGDGAAGAVVAVIHPAIIQAASTNLIMLCTVCVVVESSFSIPLLLVCLLFACRCPDWYCNL